MDLLTLPLDHLRPHPGNCNVLPAALLAKLARHIARTDQYPPIIVRALAESVYQILDGHHRVQALRQLGRTTAHCLVWQADDRAALVLLATLNRLQGHDDPQRRAALLADLHARPGGAPAQLARWLPEDAPALTHLLSLHEPPPPPAPPTDLDHLPVAVHFFLLPAQRDHLEKRLAEIGGGREAALLHAVGINEPRL